MNCQRYCQRSLAKNALGIWFKRFGHQSNRVLRTLRFAILAYGGQVSGSGCPVSLSFNPIYNGIGFLKLLPSQSKSTVNGVGFKILLDRAKGKEWPDLSCEHIQLNL